MTTNETDTPLVSVVMAVYNAGKYLDPAVMSIGLQDYANVEFIVVDDGSTDGSREKLETLARLNPRIRLILQQNRGPASARNRAIREARGTFIAVMDADDCSHPTRIRKQAAYLQAHPECVAVGSRLVMIDPEGGRIAVETDRPTTHEQILKFMQTGLGGIPNPAAMIRADILKQVEGYDESYPAAEDLDLWFRLSEHGELANLPDPLHEYRLHENSHGTTKLELQNECGKRAVLSWFQRRGEQPPPDLKFNLPAPMTRAEQRMNWAWMAVQSKNRRGALKHAWAAVKLEPTNPKLWYQWLRIRLGLIRYLRLKGTPH